MDAAGVDVQILSLTPPGTGGLPAPPGDCLLGQASRQRNDRSTHELVLGFDARASTNAGLDPPISTHPLVAVAVGQRIASRDGSP